MATFDSVAMALAEAFVGGRWEADELARRGARVVGRKRAWLKPLAARLCEAFSSNRRPRVSQVARWLLNDQPLERICGRYEIPLGGIQAQDDVMSPTSGRPESWRVPPLVNEAALADWLEIDVARLNWFADPQSLEQVSPHGPLRHYRYRWSRKRRAGSARLIEAPKWRLKNLQRRILQRVLDLIPPHRAAHGFRRARSIHTYVAEHAGRDVVIHADLKDFFPSVSKSRVISLFLTAGYPEGVAVLLAGLCTNSPPDEIWRTFPCYANTQDLWRHQALYRRPHLPQGAPCSPAIANLCAYRLDCRLDGLARAAGGRYDRYADDLLFSGDARLAKSAGRFLQSVGAIALEEGFRLNNHKSRVMRRGGRQSAAGVTLNDKPNIPRLEFDRIKAILHNCARHGVASQNRESHAEFQAHLLGRVANVERWNPRRGARLREMFNRIDWSSYR